MLRAALALGVLVFPLALGACAGYVDTAAKDAEYCPRGPVPKFQITPVLSEPKIDTKLTLNDIAVLSHVEYNHLALGATEGKLLVLSVFSAHASPSPKGGVCVYPSDVELTVSVAGRVIHVAHEFVGTEPCVYGEILGHEKHHVSLDDQLLNQAAAELRASLPARLVPLYGVWGVDEPNARASLKVKIVKQVNAIQADIQAKRDAAHAEQVDTPEENVRLREACNGRLEQLYPRYR